MSIDDLLSKTRKPISIALITLGSLGFLGNTYNIHTLNKNYNSLDNQLGLAENRSSAIDSDFVEEKTRLYNSYRAVFGLSLLAGASLLYRRKKR